MHIFIFLALQSVWTEAFHFIYFNKMIMTDVRCKVKSVSIVVVAAYVQVIFEMLSKRCGYVTMCKIWA